ncbi:MAG: hypothetical protein IV092_25290 [Burkholderiaceae bacterium]|nr:hypothetical protein [Burkholderiaceae bacterium]
MNRIISTEVNAVADQANTKVDQVASAAHAAVNSAQASLNDLGQAAPAALNRAAAQVDDMARRTLDRARQASGQVRDQVHRAGDMTVGYIKDEPVKSILIAAAAGAVAAGIFAWLTRSRARG